MPSQSVDGTITPVGEITEILIEGDNPGGTINPFGSVTWQANFGLQSPDLGGTISPTGELTIDDNAACFPNIFECVEDPTTTFDCVDTCEPNEIPTPPDHALEGIIIPVGVLVTEVNPDEEPPVSGCCLLCGDVSPEGNVDGDIACIYEWTAADVASPTLDHPIWAKLLGAGNTGWGAMYGLPGDGADSVRVGPLADASGEESVALGTSVTASGPEAIAVGNAIIASADCSIAIGMDGEADQMWAIAIGEQPHANAIASLAVGYGSTVNVAAHNGIAIGSTSDVTDYDASSRTTKVYSHCSIAIGAGTIAGGDGSGLDDPSADYHALAMGYKAEATRYSTIAIGDDALAHYREGIAIGCHAWSLATLGIAIGSAAVVKGTAEDDANSGIAIGASANAGAYQSIAIGAGSVTGNGKNANIALGTGSLASHDGAIVLGNNARSTVAQQLMIGDPDSAPFAYKIKEVRFNHADATAGCPNIVMANAALATGATEGFPYFPSCPGTPSGTPHAYTGAVPCIVDTTAGKVWFYYGGAWHFTTLT